jgi:hypothetical protein
MRKERRGLVALALTVRSLFSRIDSLFVLSARSFILWFYITQPS